MRLTDIEKKAESEPVDLKSGKKKRVSIFAFLKNRIKRKDLSGTPKHTGAKIRLNEIKQIGKYLYRLSRKAFKKLQKIYDNGNFKRSLTGTLPSSWSPKELDFKKTGKSKKLASLSFVVIVFLFFILANIGALIVNSATLKSQVLEDISEGYTLLQEGRGEILTSNLISSQEKFVQASEKFGLARKQVTQINRGVNLIHVSPLSTGANLLSAGENLSQAGAELVSSIDTLLKTQNLNQALEQFEEAYDKLKKARRNLGKVNLTLLPDKHQEQLREVTALLDKINGKIYEYEYWLPTLKGIFGEDAPKRYLIAFLNSSEIRPCGGFLGSFAIADFQNGSLKNLDILDTYTVDWQLWDEVEAPEPLRPFMQTLHMRDSAYLANFPACAEEINYFYERAHQGSSLNGVIAINEGILANLLAITGPIELEEYGLTFDQENFFTLLQVEIESSKDHPETPKQILLDLVPKVQEAILKTDPGSLLTLLEEAISQKDIQAYFFDKQDHALAESLNLSSELPSTEEQTDFLLISDFNVGGNKSSRYLKDEILHRSNLKEEEIENTIVFKRSHTWTYRDKQTAYRVAPKLYGLSYRQQSDIVSILGAGSSHHVTQIMVPKGSQLTETVNIDNVQSLELENYTTFYFDWNIPAASSKEIILRYKLPFALDKNDNLYSLEIIKQSGKHPVSFSKEIDLGRDFHFEDGSTWFKENFSLDSDTTFAKDFYKN